MIEREIPNADLVASDIPAAGVSREEIERFALTFDGYAAWGSLDKCAEVASERRHETLTNLRTCLFFEQRRLYWSYPDEPDEEELAYMHFLIEEIRRHVKSNTQDHKA